MRALIVLLLAFSTNLFADAAVSQEYSDRSKFEYLTKRLFDDDRVDNSMFIGVPISPEENRAVNGGQYLYCAIIADYLGGYDDAIRLYDMALFVLDEFAELHAIRDMDLQINQNQGFLLNSIPEFQKSWLINDKSVLKGAIFEAMLRIIDNEFYRDNPLGKKQASNFYEIYRTRCSDLK